MAGTANGVEAWPGAEPMPIGRFRAGEVRRAVDVVGSRETQEVRCRFMGLPL